MCKAGYFLFPTLGSSALSSADQSVSQSPWEVHMKLATRIGTWAGCQVCVPRQGVLSLITLALFCTLPGTHKLSWLELHYCALLRAQLISAHNVQTLWLSFLVVLAVLVMDSRGHTTCSAKKPAGLQTADTWPGQSPKCVPTNMIYRIKAHPNRLGRNVMEHVALNKWAEWERVVSSPWKWWAFRHQ